jgi:hypothetical protein
MNRQNLDQWSTLGLGAGLLLLVQIQRKIATGLIRPTGIPDLRIRRMFSRALPGGPLEGPARAFYRFAKSIRKELSATSVPSPKSLELRRGPEGCVENGSAASLLVSHVSI